MNFFFFQTKRKVRRNERQMRDIYLAQGTKTEVLIRTANVVFVDFKRNFSL